MTPGEMSRVNDGRRAAEKALRLAEKKGEKAIANRLREAIALLIDAVAN